MATVTVTNGYGPSGTYLSMDASPFPVTSSSLKKEISRAADSAYMSSEISDMIEDVLVYQVEREVSSGSGSGCREREGF